MYIRCKFANIWKFHDSPTQPKIDCENYHHKLILTVASSSADTARDGGYIPSCSPKIPPHINHHCESLGRRFVNYQILEMMQQGPLINLTCTITNHLLSSLITQPVDYLHTHTHTHICSPTKIRYGYTTKKTPANLLDTPDTETHALIGYSRYHANPFHTKVKSLHSVP